MNPALAYMSQQLSSSSPARRVAMLHDRAIGALRETIQAISQGDIQRRWNASNLATQIIELLWMTLDLERGGTVAANLDRLYSFMTRHLSAVNLRNDPQPARDVIELLEPLRQSWHALASSERAAESPELPTPAAVRRLADASKTNPTAKRLAVSA